MKKGERAMALAAVVAGLCCLIGGALLASPGSFAKGFWEGVGGTLAIAGTVALVWQFFRARAK
ncbi:hypothetical protein LJB68_10555 [bacterium 210820-DFI.6.52]|nr:hypothetical protein [bacterium 210820-DFI.6.52]